RSSDLIRSSKRKHFGHKSAVASAINADAFWVHSVVLDHVVESIELIVVILAAEKIVNIRSPVASVTGRAAIVDVKDDITFLRQQLIEYELAVIVVPYVDSVLQISGAMDKNHHLIFFLLIKVGRKIDL